MGRLSIGKSESGGGSGSKKGLNIMLGDNEKRKVMMRRSPTKSNVSISNLEGRGISPSILTPIGTSNSGKLRLNIKKKL